MCPYNLWVFFSQCINFFQCILYKVVNIHFWLLLFKNNIKSVINHLKNTKNLSLTSIIRTYSSLPVQNCTNSVKKSQFHCFVTFNVNFCNILQISVHLSPHYLKWLSFIKTVTYFCGEVVIRCRPQCHVKLCSVTYVALL